MIDHAMPLIAANDLAGLAVHDAEGLLAGQVIGVLTEAGSGLIRFIDVQLESNGRHVLVPVGHARLEEVIDRTRIRLRAAKLFDLERIPAYDPNSPVTSGYVSEIASAYGRFFRGDFYYAHPAYDHRRLYAGPHPLVRAQSQHPAIAEQLTTLRTSDFRISQGEPNIRDWIVAGADGGEVGRVEDLIIDPQAERVRYVVIAAPENRRQAIPIGYVELSTQSQQVVVPGLTALDLLSLPELSASVPTRAEEEELLAAIERALDARNPFLRVDFSERQIAAE